MKKYQAPGGDVSRWHSHPNVKLRLSGDTIDEHQISCVRWLERLFPDASEELIDAVRYHDEAERILGDMPYTAKRYFPELADAYARAEQVVIARYGIPQPVSERDADIVKLVDMFDAYWWVSKVAPEELESEAWIEHRREIERRAKALGVLEAVNEILEDV